MSKPNLPTPHAPRPDPGGQLLEAVRQRQAQRSLQLALQWAHRRGIVDLHRFCSTDVSSALGTEAASWLRDLLAQDEAIANSSSPRVSPPDGPQPSLDLVQGRPDPAQELHAKAVAAVDAAFAALAQSFLEENEAAITAPHQRAAQAQAAPTAAPVPQPLPASNGLWPSLRASAARLNLSAAVPSDDGLQRHSGDEPNGSSEPLAHGEGLLSSEAAGASSGQPRHSPTALQQAAPLAPAPDPDCAAEADLPDEQTPPADAPGLVVLVQRLRDRIQTRRLPRLSRLRALMRDCVQETMALLQPPEPERLNEDIDFELQPLPETAAGTREQPTLSWSVDSLLPEAPASNSGASPQPQAAAEPPHAPEADSGTVPVPLQAAPAPRRRVGVPTLLPTAGGDRPAPAPAPAGLSDLRAWLPDRGDLPRAS